MTLEGFARNAAIAALAALLTGCCSPLAVDSHAVNLHPQNRDWWCWAATTQMVSEFKGHTVPQCDSANFVHGTPPDCCTGCTGNCPCWGIGWGATITDVQNNWSHWDYDYTYVPSNLSWQELKRTLSNRPNCGESPIYAVTGSHVVIITAYAEYYFGNQTLRMVFYNDPWPPNCGTTDGVCTPTPGGATLSNTYEAFAPAWWATFHSFNYTGT